MFKWVPVVALIATLPGNASSDELAEKAEALRNVKYLHDEYFSDFGVDSSQISLVVSDYVDFKVNEIVCSSDPKPSTESIVESTYSELQRVIAFLEAFTDTQYNSGETRLTLQFKFEEALANDQCQPNKQWTTPPIIKRIELFAALKREIRKREAEIVELLGVN